MYSTVSILNRNSTIYRHMKLFSRLALLTIIFYGSTFSSQQELSAQDPRFSQYYNAPIRLNPAMTGAFEGLWRVGGNFRTQWGSVAETPYTTYHAMADMKVNVGKSDYFGAGFSALTDISGGGLYNITDIGLSASYHKKLTGARRTYSRNAMTSYLSAGAQLGIGQRRINWDNLYYSTQYDPSNNTYNQGINSGEDLNRRNGILYADLSAGVMWYATFGKRNSIYAGLSLFHINSPEIGLINSTSTNAAAERLPIRTVLHVGGEILLGDRGSLSLLPGFVGMFQGPNTEANLGMGIKYQGYKYDDFAFRFGTWTRIANRLESEVLLDALVLYVGIDYLSFQFAVSYDINISQLSRVSNGQGSLEFSVIYTHDGARSREQGCPTF